MEITENEKWFNSLSVSARAFRGSTFHFSGWPTAAMTLRLNEW